MIIDKLYERVKERSFICVGLDTSFDYLPKKYQDLGVAEGLFQFNKEIIDNTYDLVAIFKLQIAYYEAKGIEGLKGYVKTIEYLKSKDQLVIGDIKRGDIADTGKMYAKAHFESEFEVDFVTLSPYMGYDSIDPYLPYLESGEKGAFVLLRTSNPGAKDIEYLEHKGRPLYYTIGDNLQEIGKSCVGESGYSALGLVTGGTQSEEAVELREAYKNSFFLIPGYGAQGATAADIRNYLNDFNGGVVNSSRGIILNFKKYEDGEDNIGKYARIAVEEMKANILGK
ncbi:MAG: orotidine-5'-phosphate decarboxylase [Tissierellia bacterium]|nr:orotidine-5'-phosphate decarboxylase [Tissierellia bacterium]